MANPSRREYWYNTKTGQVEVGQQSPWTDIMGPYDTEEEARHALANAAERNETFDEEEEAWEDDWKDDED
ncbi:hypothetical protein [Flaviflexus sp.]|uniref:hypothetical protein n=1 Tax=Flaviflexus sp. TaxID=1969482 RepID=UPI003F93E2DD